MSSIPCSFKNWSDASVYRTVADSYSQSDVDSAVGAKADASNVYTKTQVDNAVGAKLDSSAIADYSTTSQMDKSP